MDNSRLRSRMARHVYGMELVEIAKLFHAYMLSPDVPPWCRSRERCVLPRSFSNDGRNTTE